MNNNWEFDYSELYNNNNPGRNAQNTTAPEPVTPHAEQKKRGWGKRVAEVEAAVVF